MWSTQIQQMYRAWAGKRGMQVAEYPSGDATGSILTISGFGVHGRLIQEVGLHVLEPAENEEAAPRLIARVRVAPAPLGDLPAATAAKVLGGALSKVPASNTVVRRYRGGLSPLVRDAKQGWRSGKFEAILGGDFDLIGAVVAR